MLLAVIFMLALLTIALSVAVPQVTKSIQRDREIETMHRGKQYIRAIQLYYRKFHSYPPSIDALVKTDNIRFLRKRYLDPMTGKDDWKPIAFGQNKEPIAMGFFGQPLAGTAGITPIVGTGPSGGNGASTGTSAQDAGGPSSGGSSSIGADQLFGNSSPTSSSPEGSSDTGSGANTGTTGGATANSGDTTGSGSTGTGTTGTGFMSGQNGQTLGGAGIIGVEPASSKQSILLYKKKDHYNQWEFTYSPLMELKQQSGNGGLMGGSTPNAAGTSGLNTGSTGTLNGDTSTGATATTQQTQ